MTHFCEEEVGDWWSGKDVYLKDPKGKGKGKGKERDKSSSVENKGSSGNKAHGESKDKGKGKSSGVEEEVAEGERERRPLDPVEIMQRGYEKCLSCAISEVRFTFASSFLRFFPADPLSSSFRLSSPPLPP